MSIIPPTRSGSATGSGTQNASTQSLPSALQNSRTPQILEGRIAENRDNGTTRIETRRGPIEVRISGDKPSEGSRVQVEISPRREGGPEIRVRTSPNNIRSGSSTQAQNQTQNQTQQSSQNTQSNTQQSTAPQPTATQARGQAAPPAASPAPTAQPATQSTTQPQRLAPASAPVSAQASAQTAAQTAGKTTQGTPLQKPTLPNVQSLAQPASVTAASKILSAGDTIKLTSTVAPQGSTGSLSLTDKAIQTANQSPLVTLLKSVQNNGSTLRTQNFNTSTALNNPANGLLSTASNTSTASALGAGLGTISSGISSGANSLISSLLNLSGNAVSGISATTNGLSVTNTSLQGAQILTANTANSHSINAASLGQTSANGAVSGTNISTNALQQITAPQTQNITTLSNSNIQINAKILEIIPPSALATGGKSAAGTAGLNAGLASGSGQGSTSAGGIAGNPLLSSNAKPGQITGIVGTPISTGQGSNISRIPVTLFSGSKPIAGQFLLPPNTSPLSVGTQINFSILKTQQFSPTGQAMTPPNLGLGGLFQTLAGLDPFGLDILELIQTIKSASTAQASQAGLQIIPQASSPSRIPSTMLFFMAALKGADMQQWLGERTSNLLNSNGKGDLLGKLERGFSAMARSFADPAPVPGGEWRSLNLPMLFGPDLSRLQFHIRDYEGGNGQDGDGEDDANKPHKRVIIEFAMSRMGEMQIDSLLMKSRLETVLRTDTPFSGLMKQDLRQRYTEIMRSINYEGSIDFQTKE